MKIIIAAALIGAAFVAGCNEADIASSNLSTAADHFEITRRIVFINGITDKYLMTIEGRCSLGNYDKARELTVTCKTGESAYKKHFLGLSDNVTFLAEQIEASKVDPFHYRIAFRPAAIIPDIDLQTK